MKIQTRYLKRFGAWVTDLTDNYRHNPFIRATIHIVVFQLMLAALLIVITGWAIQYEQTNTVGSIQHHIQQAVSSNNTTAVKTLPRAVNNVRNRTLEYVFGGLVALIALFGYLIIRFALSPTRTSLQFQKRFIGNVAHEIRTPLAIIKTATEVALMDPNVSPALQETLADTLLELDRISQTINNLLSFNTLVRPERMRTEMVDLSLVAQAVVDRHQALAKSRGIELSTITYGKPHTVTGNTVALEQVITNLVKNALNYTQAYTGGKVVVEVDQEYGDRVAVAIIDTGIGINQKDLMHIFEPFYRGDTSRTRDIGTGTSGLGLAIVNEIVRFHEGTTTVRSAPGLGTTIRVSFPRTKRVDQWRLSSEQRITEDEKKEVGEISMDYS